jgi:hypothetical protein
MRAGFDWVVIENAIDMDEWKHSWHLPGDHEKKRQKCREILQRKLADRLNDIVEIRKALNMLEVT